MDLLKQILETALFYWVFIISGLYCLGLAY